MAARPALRVVGTRGQFVETESIVWAAVAGPDGELINEFGATSMAVPVRSTVKMLQARPLISSGAAVGLSTSELALACASHNGEDMHADVVNARLQQLGLTEADLQCGPALPAAPEALALHLAGGGGPNRSRHNCSGKHAAWLTLSAQLGAPVGSYLDSAGQVQGLVRHSLSECIGRQLTDQDFAVDGCGAPAPALALRELAAGWARAAHTPEGEILVDAMAAYPELVGGTGRFDTELSRATHGHIVVKMGADGLQVGYHRPTGTCVVTKSVAGSQPPAELALVSLFSSLGLLNHEQNERFGSVALTNNVGQIVGKMAMG